MKLDLNDVGCYVLTALRKACDSTPTSLAYNLIHACDGEWGLFLTCVMRSVRETEWSEGATFTDKVKESFKEMTKTWRSDFYPEKDELQEFNEALFASLCLSFKLFDESDWIGAMYYIEGEEKNDRR